jgi:cell division protein FtsQ
MELSLPLPSRVRRRGAPRRRRSAISDTRARLVLDWLRGNRLALRIALSVLVAVPLLAGGWLWLRESSLVAVRHVHITGVHGPDALEIRQALDRAAARMTTMDFNVGRLRSAVSSFAIVGALRASTSFPHSVTISVTERPPVAALLTAGQRTAIAADGTVLGPALLLSSLPSVPGSVEPQIGARLREPAALAAVVVLGAAPTQLARFVLRVFNGPEGLTVAMRNGLLVYFGNATRPHAKWVSLARVLVSPSAAGSLYVDVRLPERPAAGFSSASPSVTSAPAATEAGSSEPTAAALAASLSKATGASTGASAGSTSSTSESEASGESETTSAASTTTGSGESEASSGASETSSSSSRESPSAATAGGGSSATGASSEASITAAGGAASTAAAGG